MSAELFGVRPDGTAVASDLRPAFPSERPTHAHRFGGPARHQGAVLDRGEHPLLLLFDLDLTDPRVPLSSTSSRTLPLYNAIRFDSASMAYQVVSDDEIRIVRFDDDKRWTPHFPYPDFPKHLPEMNAVLTAPEEIEPDDHLDAWQDLWGRDEPTDESPGPRDLILLEAYVLQEWNDQGVPCENPTCGYGRTDLFAAMRREPFASWKVFLWNDGEDHEPDVVIRYRICPKCQTIHVANLAN